MARVYLLLFVLEIVLTVLALISCLSAYESEVRGLPRVLWVIVIVLFPIGGAIIYYVGGRPLPAGATSRGGWLTGSGPATPVRGGRSPAPDDDSAFLQSIDSEVRRSDEELLRRWEEDLKKREDDIRKPEETPPSDG